MGNVNSILDQRIKKGSNTTKMAAMAKQSAAGNLTSFSGIFSVVELSPKEKNSLAEILKNHAQEDQDIHGDLDFLISLTAEVKAINNQAALLHGERIKKAHQVLTRYRDGAFTAWLIAAYGNRQTPYNLMQYYEFYEKLPKQLRPQIELMPRQAVYVLASRVGDLDQKQAIVENYQGQTKAEMLSLIRQVFPLDQTDKRKLKMGKGVIRNLKQIYCDLQESSREFTSAEEQEILALLKQIQQLIKHP
jgi:Uncharacterised protein family (UPF0137)